MTEQVQDDDVLTIEGEVGRMQSANNYYMIDLPKGTKRFKVEKECQMELVIVPYRTTCSPHVAPGKLYYTRDYYRFRGLGPSQKDSYFDSALSFGEKCAITEALAGAGLKTKSQRMTLMNVFVLSVNGVDVNELQLMDYSYVNFTEKLFVAANTKKIRRGQEFVNTFPCHKNGSIITCAWHEKMMGKNKFFVAGEFDFVKHDGLDGKVATLMTAALDLDTMFNKLPYDEARRRFIDCVPSPPSGEGTKPANTSKDAAPPKTETKPAPADDAPLDEGW